MNNLILDFMKNTIMKDVKTTKDLIYKDKIIDPYDIDGSYIKLCNDVNNEFYGMLIGADGTSYINGEHLSIISHYHASLSNVIFQKNKGRMDVLLNNFKESETFNSLWIEGIHSSRKKIKQAIKEKNKEKSKEIFIRNYIEAINFTLSTEEFSESTIFTLYTILSRDVDMKDEKLDGIPYRKEDVEINTKNGIKKGLDPIEISRAINQIIVFVNNLMKFRTSNWQNLISTLAIHYVFELIHPYYDMNGRMGRLMLFWISRKLGLAEHMIYFSEAINLFKEEYYYNAFTNSEEKGFKKDVTYFCSATSTALIGEKIIYLVLEKVNNKVKENHSKGLSQLEKTILKSLLSKEIEFYKKEEFILGVEDINKSQVSTALNNLVEYSIIKETNTKPKEYKLVIDSIIKKVIDEQKIIFNDIKENTVT